MVAFQCYFAWLMEFLMIPSSSNFNPQNYVSFLDFAPCCSSNTHLYREVASLLGWYYYFFICLILGSLSLLFFLALNLHRNALKSSSISSIFIATFRTKIVQVDFAWISEPIFLFMVSTSTLESFLKKQIEFSLIFLPLCFQPILGMSSNVVYSSKM